MATRSLTEAFILMRNNALQSRHLFSDHLNDDKELLVRKDNTDIELGNSTHLNGYLPMQWQSQIDEIKLAFSKIKTKMSRLSELHDKHLNRPTMHDSTEEEELIQQLTTGITADLHKTQQLIKRLQGLSRLSSGEEEDVLGTNMVATVARNLQELSSTFRASQSQYLKKVEGREERHSQYFTIDNKIDLDTDNYGQPDFFISTEQMQRLEEDSVLVDQREKQIGQVVRSIQDLNDIFKELSVIIVDQGTILDRIDYNIEHTSVSVEKGLKQLTKAEKHQKKNRKMYCVLVLFVVVVLMFVILVATKS